MGSKPVGMKLSRRLVRSAMVAFLVHGVIVVVLVLDLERNLFPFNGYVLLETVDYPVLWAIQGLFMRRLFHRFFVDIVFWLAGNDLRLGSTIAVMVIHAFVGGVFYAAIAAGGTLLWSRRGRLPRTPSS